MQRTSTWLNRFCMGWLTLCLMAPMAPAYQLKDNAILHAEKGQVLMTREYYAEAAEEFKAALRLNPQSTMSASLYNNLGIAYRRLKQYPVAFASFQHAIRLQPTYALYYKNLIESYAEAGHLAKVKAQLQQVVKDNPRNAEAWFMLGLAHTEQGQKAAAKSCFSRFLALQPHAELAAAAKSYL